MTASQCSSSLPSVASDSNNSNSSSKNPWTTAPPFIITITTDHPSSLASKSRLQTLLELHYRLFHHLSSIAAMLANDSNNHIPIIIHPLPFIAGSNPMLNADSSNPQYLFSVQWPSMAAISSSHRLHNHDFDYHHDNSLIVLSFGFFILRIGSFILSNRIPPLESLISNNPKFPPQNSTSSSPQHKNTIFLLSKFYP